MTPKSIISRTCCHSTNVCVRGRVSSGGSKQRCPFNFQSISERFLFVEIKLSAPKKRVLFPESHEVESASWCGECGCVVRRVKPKANPKNPERLRYLSDPEYPQVRATLGLPSRLFLPELRETLKQPVRLGDMFTMHRTHRIDRHSDWRA